MTDPVSYSVRHGHSRPFPASLLTPGSVSHVAYSAASRFLIFWILSLTFLSLLYLPDANSPRLCLSWAGALALPAPDSGSPEP